jgi:hypothetical protein
MKPGDWFQVPAGMPRSVQNGEKITCAKVTIIVEKDKLLVSFG